MLLPGPKIPLAKKYLQQPSTVNMQRVVRAQKKVTAELRRKQLARNIALARKQQIAKQGQDAQTQAKRKTFEDKRAVILNIKEAKLRNRDIERHIYKELKDATWIQQRKNQMVQSGRGSVFSAIFGSTVTKTLEEAFVSLPKQLQMKRMCWLVIIRHAKWGRFMEIVSGMMDHLRVATGKKKEAMLVTIYKELFATQLRLRRPSSIETMMLVKLCNSKLGKRVTIRRQVKSLDIAQAFLRDHRPIGINYLRYTMKKFVQCVIKAQRMGKRFLKNNHERVKMLDRVWQLVESGIITQMHETELARARGVSTANADYVHELRFSNHSITAVTNAVRPKIKYEPKKHDAGIMKMIAKMQGKGTVEKELSQKDTQGLMKILVPTRQQAGMAKSQVPKKARQKALLNFLQQCRRTHQESKETKDALKRVRMKSCARTPHVQLWLLLFALSPSPFYSAH
jgi:hypothetical protein